MLLLVLVAVLPMFRRGSNALEDGEAGDTCAFGGGTGDDGVVAVFMNPNEDAGAAEGGEGIPAATAAVWEVSDGCTVSTLASALLIFILPNKSLDPLPDTTGTVLVVAGATFISVPKPPSKSSCCCDGATGMGGTGTSGAVCCCWVVSAALVFNPLNNESPPTDGIAATEELSMVVVWTTGAGSSEKSNKLVGGASTAAASPLVVAPFIIDDPSTPNIANTRFAGPFTLARA